MLERRQEGYQSKRFTAIKKFFESAVSVVPLESLFHAMGNAKHEVVLQCCEIFSSSDTLRLETLSSEFLLASLESALSRIGQFQHYVMNLPQIHKRPKGSSSVPFAAMVESALDDEYLEKFGSELVGKLITKRDEYYELLHKTYCRLYQLMEKCKRGKGRRSYQRSPCDIDLEVIYPSADVKNTRKRNVKCCKAPMTLLRDGRKELNRLSLELIAEHSGSKEESSSSNTNATSNTNARMLSKLTNLREQFETCSTLLGAFMESRAQIPLGKAGGDKYANKFAEHASSQGLSVWGLLILPFEYLIRRKIGNLPEDVRQFVVEFSYYIRGIRNRMFPPSEHQFAGYDERLEFLVGSMKKSSACNRKYVSYSLERQLEDQCKKRNIYHNTSVDDILSQWNDNFENERLTLVLGEYRRLVARWIKWSLMINNLRECLARQTAVGVIGLVNSGKSKFVRSLFGEEV